MFAVMSFAKKFLRVTVLCMILTTLFIVSASAACVGVGTVNEDAAALRLRSEPSSDASILATAPQGDIVVVLEQVDEAWYKVDYKSVEGYMSAEYLDVVTTANVDLGYGIVNEVSSMLNVRSGPGTEYPLVDTLRNRSIVSILGVEAGWYKISFGNVVGYVSSDYLSLCKDSSGLRADEDPTSAITLGNQIVAYGEQFLGIPYVWGGNGPRSFDCSGFTKYVMNHFGYDISRTASAQVTNGVAVSHSELQPGDLVFFHTFSSYVYITHVGIYAGNGQFIHASSTKGITYSDMNSSYYNNAYVSARRIINQ